MAPIIPAATSENSLELLRQKIREVLRFVRDRLGLTGLEPPLTEDHFGDLHTLPADCPSHDFKTLLECATKSILYEIATRSLLDERFSSFCNLLDLSLVLTELELTDAALPFILIEELFDSQTIDSCQQLFGYLESRVERLTVEIDGTKGKGPILLRLCNELLRRLSKAEDTIFCGRILIFLSKSFILGERSGVNLRGEFNVENTTSFDNAVTINGDKMEIESEMTKAREGEGEVKSDDGGKSAKTVSFEAQHKVDLSAGALYPIFWSLQNYFSNPPQLFVATNFETFKNGLAATLAKFKAVDEEQRQQGTSAAVDEVRREKRKRASDEDMGAHFNPKYLTSRELFELELSDLTFRRHVLVQSLILIDFLLSLTPAAKEKWAEIAAPNRSVQYAFTLSLEDEKWAIKTRSLICEYLQPNHDGRLFMRLVETILTRDKNWVQWKVENCLSFEKKPVPEGEVMEAMNNTIEFCKPARPYQFAMGAPALSRLWRDASKNPGLEGLKHKKKDLLPSLEPFRTGVKSDEEAVKDALRPEQAEEAAAAKASKIWRALRLASRDRFHIFNKFDDKPDDDRNELEMLFDLEREEHESKRQKIEDRDRDRVSVTETTQPDGSDEANAAEIEPRQQPKSSTDIGSTKFQRDIILRAENSPTPG